MIIGVKRRKNKQTNKQASHCLNNSTQLELPQSSFLVCADLLPEREVSRRERTERGAEVKAVSVAPKSPICGVVVF